jgi:threonine dehydrogenase-like Zn-dependent dehydrogenase
MFNRAMVLTEFGKPLQPREMPVPALKPGQLLVKLLAAGVCGSDVHMRRGEDPRTPLPIILGHEGVGEVAAAAGPVKSVEGDYLHEGDRILWNRGVVCGCCFYCTVLKEPSLCLDRKIYGINLPADVPPYLSGCYSEHIILLPGTDIFKIGPEADPGVLVSASCSGATLAHAFDLAAPLPGDTVVVQGPGPLGVYAVAFARLYGAAQVVVIGGSGNRLEICSEFGATTLLDRHKTTPEERRSRILEMTGGRGADLVVEAVGYPDALEEGLDLVRRGGSYLSTGFAQPVGLSRLDPYEQIVKKNIRLQGVWASDSSHLYRAMKLVLSNQALFQKMVTHRFSLDQANEALQAMADRQALKAVINRF